MQGGHRSKILNVSNHTNRINVKKRKMRFNIKIWKYSKYGVYRFGI